MNDVKTTDEGVGYLFALTVAEGDRQAFVVGLPEGHVAEGAQIWELAEAGDLPAIVRGWSGRILAWRRDGDPWFDWRKRFAEIESVAPSEASVAPALVGVLTAGDHEVIMYLVANPIDMLAMANDGDFEGVSRLVNSQVIRWTKAGENVDYLQGEIHMKASDFQDMARRYVIAFRGKVRALGSLRELGLT